MAVARMPSTLTTVDGTPLSRIGLGTASLGRANDRAQFEATFRRAADLGLNWVDTDAVFGFGEAELLIGRILANLPAERRPFVATAVGLDWDGRLRRPAPQSVIEPHRLRQQLERSLTRLGLETVDLVKLNVDTRAGALFEDAWSTLLDFKQGGLVRAVGLVAPDSAHLERAERIGACDAVYVKLSLIDRRICDSELMCRQAPTPAVIGYRALAGGELTTAGRLAEMLGAPSLEPLRQLLRTIAGRRRATPSSVAAAWSLTWPGIAGLAIGTRSPEHIADIVAAPDIELSVRDLSDIANLLPTLGAGQGPSHPRRFAKAA